MLGNLITAIRSGFVTGVPTHFPPNARHANGSLSADASLCNGCQECVKACPVLALTAPTTDSGNILLFHPGRCAGCVRCVDACVSGALHFVPLNETFQVSGMPDQKKLIDLPVGKVRTVSSDSSSCEKRNGDSQA